MFTYYKTCDFRKTGLHHTLQHRPCEDHTAMRIGPGGCTAITLADGAGSYSKADTGAQITRSPSSGILKPFGIFTPSAISAGKLSTLVA